MIRKIILALLLFVLLVPCSYAQMEVIPVVPQLPSESIDEMLEEVTDPSVALSALYRALMCAYYLETSDFRQTETLPSCSEYILVCTAVGIKEADLFRGYGEQLAPDRNGSYVYATLGFDLYDNVDLIAYMPGVFVAQDASDEEIARAHEEALSQNCIEYIVVSLEGGVEVTIARFN